MELYGEIQELWIVRMDCSMDNGGGLTIFGSTDRISYNFCKPIKRLNAESGGMSLAELTKT